MGLHYKHYRMREKMEIPFVKMHGLGNNYIYVDFFQYQVDECLLSDLAIQVANVNTGIGSDGLILIHPSKVASVGMRIFNKDGSEGTSCGNGLRCTAKYAYEHGLVHGRHFTIETKAGIVDVVVQVEKNTVKQVTVNMGPPRLSRSHIPMLGSEENAVIDEPFKIQGEQLRLTALFLGNPNAVFFVNNIAEAPVARLGSSVERDPRFPNRVNVEFVEVLSEWELDVRIWERGSGATQACGTGACAAVVAAILNGYIRKKEDILVHLPGGDLLIQWDEHDDVWMTGEAEIIATGVYRFEG